jgi:hypothetical protein
MPAPDDGPVYVDDDHAAIAEFAAVYMDEDERETFVDHLMERRGYTKIQSWGPRTDPGPDPGPDPDPQPRRSQAPAQPRQPRKSPYFKR